ncbi:MAG: competence/damage-inducible protein A [Bdellovibrionales bacterium]
MPTTAILAVGTELTSGEIINSNGAWLGDKLEDLGFQIHSQVVVPDERQTIHETLTWLQRKNTVLVVTGGLGPTSDDFTREVIADWCGQPLEFNEDIWRQMNQLYQERGLTIRPAHRQQCYFPKQAEVLRNHVGTAHGFLCEHQGCKIVVLPGPPREIEGMWDLEVVPRLRKLSAGKTSLLKIWTCLGVTESEAAEAAEEAVAGSGYQIGYRATLPYVKVKLWIPRGEKPAEKVVEKLERALKPWIVARDREDLLRFLFEKIKDAPVVHALDQASQGRLAQRVSGLDEGWPVNLSLTTMKADSQVQNGLQAMTEGLGLFLKPDQELQSFIVGWTQGDKMGQETLRLPFTLTVASKRGSLYLTEMAIRWWFEHLPE